MTKRSATYVQAEVSRAIRAVIEATGVDVTRLRVRGDKAGFEITIRSKGETAGAGPGAERNPWDEVLVNGASGEEHA